MKAYNFLSRCYDEFTEDVPYDDFIKYYEEIFIKLNKNPKLLLDLGCGTGTLTLKLAKKGYEMIGVDMSSDMLMEAQNKSYELLENRPIFLCQPMHKLDLFGTIDACISSLDCINYITKEEELIKTFELVDNFLEPDGVFIFDINTPYKLKNLDSEAYVRQNENFYCVWQASFLNQICTYDFDIFVKNKDKYDRYSEVHKERAYEIDYLKEKLEQAGFYDILCFDDLSWNPPSNTSERVFFACKSKGDKKCLTS